MKRLFVIIFLLATVCTLIFCCSPDDNSVNKQDLELVILGTAQFGMNYGIANNVGKIKKNDVINILNFAYKQGIDTIDTACSYGSSEKKLGQLKINNII